MILSIDIETYGACTHDAAGDPLPPQTVWHPNRARQIDGLDPLRTHAVLTCAVTRVEGDPDDLTTWRPTDTRVFKMHLEDHRAWLRRWIDKATTIVGMNLGFDLVWLAQLNYLSVVELVPFDTRLVDLSVVNYLQDETRTEKSLKSLGPLLSLYSYDQRQSLKHHRYPDPNDPALLSYNAQDSHNTVLAIAELARRIRDEYGPDTGKLKPDCLSHYSDVLWTIVEMTRRGVPLDLVRLRRLERRLRISIDRVERVCERLGLLLHGKGSASSMARSESTMPSARREGTSPGTRRRTSRSSRNASSFW